jgi:hypothetical protein
MLNANRPNMMEATHVRAPMLSTCGTSELANSPWNDQLSIVCHSPAPIDMALDLFKIFPKSSLSAIGLAPSRNRKAIAQQLNKQAQAIKEVAMPCIRSLKRLILRDQPPINQEDITVRSRLSAVGRERQRQYPISRPVAPPLTIIIGGSNSLVV